VHSAVRRIGSPADIVLGMRRRVSENDVLDFWFADPARWWKKDPAFDGEIRSRFSELHESIERGEHEEWRDTPRGALAYVIVLDQFSRNMFRGTARMFASDAQALAAARAAIERSDDQALASAERSFLYMPLMHSEDLADQERCVALFQSFAAPGQLRYAEQHRDIIRRFGRFPHRNELLGRASTPEELEFLTQPGSSF
jgi:uncharacterized protein (DUF924 family)